MILLDTMWHKYDTSPPTAPSHSPPLTLPTLFSRLPSTLSLRGSMRSKPGAPSRRVLPCLPLVGRCGTGAATAVSPRHQQWPLPSQEEQHVALSLYVVLLGSNMLPGVSMGTNTHPRPPPENAASSKDARGKAGVVQAQARRPSHHLHNHCASTERGLL